MKTFSYNLVQPRTICLIIIMMLVSISSQAQNQLATYEVSPGWFRMEGGIDAPPADFLRSYLSNWRMTSQDELKLHKIEADSLNYLRYRFHQYYHGYNVENTDLFLHYLDSLLVEANGILVPNINVPYSPMISEAQALDIALQYVGGSQYAWENEAMEAELREETGNPNSTHFPKGELVVAHILGEPFEAKYYKFAYRFNIYVAEPFGHEYVYVDATTGESIQRISQIHNCFVGCKQDHHKKPIPNINKQRFARILADCDQNGSAHTLYNGYQTIKTTYRKWPYKNHILQECDRDIHTKWGWGLNPEVTDNDGNWENNDQTATSAHWAGEKSWDYYKFTFGRVGTNGDKRQLKILADEDNVFAVDNAYHHLSSGGNDKIHVGRWTSNNMSLASVDVIGHEFTHGVTKATSNLVYQGESGALNESFSDIFGTMIERYAQNNTFDWLLGEDTGVITRSMQNPPLYNQPNNYLDTLWAPTGTGSTDAGGVHTNSGVQNRWFFLLTSGGTQNGINVQGIGIQDAASIAYRSLTTKLQQGSQYTQAREASIASAIELFGNCSNQVAQVRNAWAAVNVGTAQVGGCIAISGQSTRCFPLSSPLIYNAQTNVAGAISWNVVPTNVSYQLSNNNTTLTIISVPAGVTLITITATVGANVTSNFSTTIKNCPTRPCRKCDWLLEQQVVLEQLNAQVTETIKDAEVKIYPNPAQEFVMLDMGVEITEQTTAILTTFDGKELKQYGIKQRTEKLNIANLPVGLYFLKVATNKGNQVFKIQIIH